MKEGESLAGQKKRYQVLQMLPLGWFFPLYLYDFFLN